MCPGKAEEVHVVRADNVGCLHGRVLDQLTGVRGDGGERRAPLGIVEGKDLVERWAMEAMISGGMEDLVRLNKPRWESTHA